MYGNVDLLLLAVLVIAAFQGWRNGFVQSLIVPVSFFLSIFIAVIYLDVSWNIVKSIFAFTVSLLSISIALRVALLLARRNLDAQERKFVSPISRASGIILNTIWQGFLVTSFLALVMALPEGMPNMKIVQEHIQKSAKFAQAYPLAVAYAPDLKNIQNTIRFLTEEANYESIASSSEFTNFIATKNVQELFADTEAMAFFAEKNYFKLILHPKVQAVVKDNLTMRGFSKLILKIYEANKT